MRRTPKHQNQKYGYFSSQSLIGQLLSINVGRNTPAEGIGYHNIHVLAKLMEDFRMEHETEPLYLC